MYQLEGMGVTLAGYDSRFSVRAIVVIAFCCVVRSSAAENDDPVITPLVPGMIVEELPVELTNINNLRFRSDGQLTALGYNGKVYLLNDSNGDGLEDSAELFWDQATIRVPVGMAWSERGLYVSSQGKVSLLRDVDGDETADSEEIVASGWEATDVGSGGVDATAVTLDSAGNVYFGVICANYSNPYRLKEGRSRYDLSSRRGTINRLSADHSKLEVLCTGIRVPYALAFNRHGDLFSTDQEGETWLPGGNPLDELNHIVAGKHYGFPPRHAEYLPHVIDEPPVVAFGPQHQSACGLVFNDVAKGRATFGPKWWTGDALVAGQSRGLIWRVKLVKTPHGYVGVPAAIARSRMLLPEVVVSPAGDLYVACHSGSPDWGTGPEGAGKLFRIRFADRDIAQPVVAYSTGPLEVRVAFDRPLDPGILQGLTEQHIVYGKYVRAADELENLKPPYKTVKQQGLQPRGKLRITAAKLTDDRRTVVLRTDPHPVAEKYSLALNARDSGAKDGRAEGVASKAVYLDYDLSGVQATWTPIDGKKPGWSGWWPHVDLDVVHGLAAESAEHTEVFRLLGTAGTLVLRGKVQLPEGKVTVRLESSAPCTLEIGDASARSDKPTGARHVCELTVESTSEPLSFYATSITRDQEPLLHLSYHTANDPTQRVVELQRFSVPWSPPATSIVENPKVAEPAQVTGDARLGEAIFTGQVAKCSACHAIHGRGMKLGPDLSQLVHRDINSILRDIREPSAMINPDYLSYTLILKDGRTVSGVIRAEGSDAVRLASSDAKETVIALEDVEEMHPQSTSMMPGGLLDSLSETDVQNLLAYLVSPPPQPEQRPSPRVRSRAELESILRAVPALPESTSVKPIIITLVAGKKDHGPGEHDYPAWQRSWQQLLKKAKGLTVETVQNWPSADQWKRSDVVVFYLWNHDWSAKRYAEIDAFLARGGGAVAIHSALIADSHPEKLAERWGLAAQPRRTKYRHGPLELLFNSHASSEIGAGFNDTPLVDETYWPMIGDASRVQIIASAIEDDKRQPMIWTYRKGEGRVFASVLGHYTKTLDDPGFRILILRGIAWAADEPLGRLQGLAVEEL